MENNVELLAKIHSQLGELRGEQIEFKRQVLERLNVLESGKRNMLTEKRAWVCATASLISALVSLVSVKIGVKI